MNKGDEIITKWKKYRYSWMKICDTYKEMEYKLNIKNMKIRDIFKCKDVKLKK